LHPQAATEGVALPSTIRLRELWAIFQDAGTLMQMIQYAERNCASAATSSLAELRNEVVRIRFGALNRMLLHSYLERLR